MEFRRTLPSHSLSRFWTHKRFQLPISIDSPSRLTFRTKCK
ncbi:MAG: hypothetical protein ACTS44_01640 [Candidatus Hodgkinia cicadicola]